MSSNPMSDRVRPRASGEIVPVSVEELPRIAQFLAIREPNYSESAWLARFEHWWAANPYWETGSPRGYCVRDEARIVGFYGLIPMGFQLKGRDALVYAGTTWQVDPAYGRHSLPLLTRVIRHVKDSLFFTWTGDAGVARTLRALHFAELPRPEAIRQLSSNTVLLRTDHLGPAVLRLGQPLARVHASLITARMRWTARSLSARRVDRADGGFDLLWRRTRANAPNTQPRDSRFIQWHCFGSDVFPKRVYGCYRGDELCGILTAADATARGSVRLLLTTDLWTNPDVPAATDALVAAAIGDAERDGFDAFVLPAWTETFARTARSHAFLPRRATFYPEFVRGPREVMNELLSDCTQLNGFVGDRYL